MSFCIFTGFNSNSLFKNLFFRYYQIIVIRVKNSDKVEDSAVVLAERIRPFNDSNQPEFGVPYITCQFPASNYGQRKLFTIGSTSENCTGNVTSNQRRRKRATSCGNYQYKNPSLSPSSYYVFFTRAILNCDNPKKVSFAVKIHWALRPHAV